MNGETNSAALDKFLEDVRRAKSDLAWTDRATRRRVDYRARLDDQPMYTTNRHSTAPVNTVDVLRRADIGYGSGLRGKRSFDRNYEAMWMPTRKKQHGEESRSRDIPRRVYLDNDVTFKRDADSADYGAIYQFPSMSDGAVYVGGAMADQSLKDWPRKKDLRSSGDWSNSNENPEVTYGESAWLRDYEPARDEFLDSSRDAKRLRVQNRAIASVVSLYDPIRTEVSAVPRAESPVATLKNEKSQNTPLYLESLKKTVLELKHSLIPGNEKKNTTSRGESDRWHGPRSVVEVVDFEKISDDHPVEEAMWRIKRAKNIRGEDNASFPRALYFGEQNLVDSHDRGKRTRRSFTVANTNYTNDRTDISENIRHRDAPGNLTANSAGIDVKSRSNYLDNGSVRISSEMNILHSRKSLNDNSINSTAGSKTDNERTISNPRYPARLESCLNNRSIDDTSVSLVQINPQTNSSSQSSDQFSTYKSASKSIHRASEDRADLFGRNVPVLNATIISIHLSRSNADDSREKTTRNHGGEKKKGVAARKITRLCADEGQSGQSKDAGEEFPRGNMSRGTVANELRCRVVETTAAATEKEEEEEEAGDGKANGTRRKENREPILGVITSVFVEPPGHPYQKRETTAAARLSRRRMEVGGAKSAGEIRASIATTGESRNANASSPPIDPVATKPEAGNINTSGRSITPKSRRENIASIIVDDDLPRREQQQMVPPSNPQAGCGDANKSDGNSDRDGIDIRAPGSRGNETMNVKEDTRAVTEAGAEYVELGNDLRRKLLWIATTFVDAEAPSTDIPILNASIGIHIEAVIGGENRRERPATTNLSNFKVSSGAKREDNSAEENSVPQSAFDSQFSDQNRCKRSSHFDGNSEISNESGPRDAAVEKEAAENKDDKQEDDNEDYLNQNVNHELKRDYNNREEDAVEDDDDDDDKVIENERAERASLGRKIDPVKAKVNLLIKKKLERKKEEEYRRKRRSALDTIEYYDYDDDEEQERDAPVNDQQTNNEDDKLLFKDEAKTKREGRTANLGKKKNEHAEEMMRQEILKKQRKNKEPKEEIVIDVGERRNKTAGSSGSDRKPASWSGSEDGANKDERSTKENSAKIHQNDGSANAHYKGDLKLKWLDRSSESKIVSPDNPESALRNTYEKKFDSKETVSKLRIDVNPEVIDNILLNIQPFKFVEHKKELEVSKNVYDDFENKRSDGCYDDQENDRRGPNNVESPLYEELKNVYDWSDELKSGPRLRGDQRLRYESDDKPDTNPSQLQPLNDRFLGTDQNARQIRPYDASWTTGLNSTPVNYLALKVADDMFKGGPEQDSSIGENAPHKFVVGATVEPKIAENKNSPFSGISAIEHSQAIDKDSPYEARGYEFEMSKGRKRNLNPEKRVAISSRDLHESFVESLDWHDDFDDSVKMRFGRGLKAVDEATSDSDKIDGLTVGNKVGNINSGFNFPQNSSYGNMSISQDRYNNNTPANLIDIYNRNRYYNRSVGQVYVPNLMSISNGSEDLEVAEQRYTTRQTPRSKRAAVAYRALYDDSNPSNSIEENNLDNRFSLSHALEDRSDLYHEYTPNWDDLQDRYLKTPRSVGKREKSKGDQKRKKQFPKKHARKKGSSRSSTSRNRRHHHRSDASRNANRNDLKPKTQRKKQNKASSVTGRTEVQKSKSAERGPLLRAAEAYETPPIERVLYENAEDQSTVKPEDDDARRKEITLLLAADNVDDESQMDMAVHGELAGKIVEHIFQQVQKHDQLKKVLGPGLQRNYKENVIVAGNIYRQGLDKDETNRTETMKRVTELLDRLILNEVQKRTCVSLSPDMREFLGWMLEVDREEESSEAFPLPLVREEIIPDQSTERQFLFDTSEQDTKNNISDLQTKVKVLETLVNEYNALTTKEKTRVQSVHDYLVRQLNLLLQRIEARQSAEERSVLRTGAARTRTGSVLQYQSAAPNTTNASYSIGKDALHLPIDTRNFFRFNNASFNVMADGQFHDSHIASHYRGTRSLGEVVSSERRETKGHRKGRKKIRSRKNSERKRNKHRKHRDRAGESPRVKRRKSVRRKRASLKKRDSRHLGYEKPTIYNSFELLDSRLTEVKGDGKGKRESTDKESAANDKMLDLLPIKGKNRLEDEVILLNKREAWRRANEEQLEEVAFGRDMRNSTKREKERFEELTAGDKRVSSIDETGYRAKREDVVNNGSSGIGSADRSDDNWRGAKSEIGKSAGKNAESGSGVVDGDENGARNEDRRLESLERTINVFGDNGSDATTADTGSADARKAVGAGEKLAVNAAAANNEVNGKLCAVNRGTKIDRADGCVVNLTSDTELLLARVSRERRKLSGADEGVSAVKLNRATNYRYEEADPEAELKSLKGGETDSKMTDALHVFGDRDLAGNKLREKYPTELDREPGDPDPENNSERLPRLRSNERIDSVVEWKLLPVIRTSPYRDSLSGIRLIGPPEVAPLNIARNYLGLRPTAYFTDNPRLWRAAIRNRRRRRNNVADIVSVVLRRVDDGDDNLRGIRSKRVTEIANDFEGSHADSKIRPRKLSSRRLRGNKRSYGVAEFATLFAALKDRDREISRSLNDPEVDDRAINDDGFRLPLRSYYGGFADSPPTLHLAPDILERDVYRYPAYLEYGTPFKERTRGSAKRRVAARNRLRSGKTSGEETVVDFPGDDSAPNRSSVSRFARGHFRTETTSRRPGIISRSTRQDTRER